MTRCPESTRDCLPCHIRDGVPTTDDQTRGYYSSRDGARMLVVERKTGQRVRINGTVEVVVLESENGKVRLGISSTPAPDTPPES